MRSTSQLLAETIAELQRLFAERDRLREVNRVLFEAAKLGLARIESDVESPGHTAPDGNAIRGALAFAKKNQ